MAKKAVYHFMPIVDRHLILSNDLDSAVELVKQYFKTDELNIEDLDELSVEFARARGLSVAVDCKKVLEKQHCYIMYIKDVCDLNVISHEATHIANFIMDYIDIPRYDEDEAQAYLIGYIAEQFMVAIRGYKPKEGALKRLKK